MNAWQGYDSILRCAVGEQLLRS